MLIDIKTTEKLELNKKYINQLVGYYILYKIGGIDGVKNLEKNFEILKLGIYFSRFGILKVFYVEDIVDLDTLPNFIQWFIDQCNNENSRGKKKYEENIASNKQDIERKITQFKEISSEYILEEIGNYVVIYIKGKEIEFYDKYYSNFINAEDFKNRYINIMETIIKDYKLEDLTYITFEGFIIKVKKWGDFQLK